jgi:hypothetical protein
MSDNRSSLVNLPRPIALQAYVFNVFGWLAEAARG